MSRCVLNRPGFTIRGPLGSGRPHTAAHLGTCTNGGPLARDQADVYGPAALPASRIRVGAPRRASSPCEGAGGNLAWRCRSSRAHRPGRRSVTKFATNRVSPCRTCVNQRGQALRTPTSSSPPNAAPPMPGSRRDPHRHGFSKTGRGKPYGAFCQTASTRWDEQGMGDLPYRHLVLE
jgi:hypothetical protein